MDSIFQNISVFFVISGIVAAVFIKSDISTGHPQKMKIMNKVWTLTGLWANWGGVYAYFSFGRNMAKNNPEKMPMQMDMKSPMGMSMQMNMKPMWQKVALSTLHCGAGCTLADIIGEWFTYFVPVSAWGSLLAGQWILDYVLALIFGLAFQYAAIKPMENMAPTQVVLKALKIDFFSLTAWQIGMYGWMAILIFCFRNGVSLPKDTWEFWFMMQIAMVCGFITSYPTNWLLIKLGIKKAM